MFSGSNEGMFCPSIRDSSGAYLIDRSYVYFEPLLNYLRTGSLIIDHNINPEGRKIFNLFLFSVFCCSLLIFEVLFHLPLISNSISLKVFWKKPNFMV